jgi:hypothetical protein
MKHFILLLFNYLIISDLCFSQDIREDIPYSYEVYQYVDSLKIKTKNVNKISALLTAPFSKDEQKAIAIFRWIANTINYDCKEFHRIMKGIINSKKQTVKKVLRRKKAVCGGYSNLYYTLAKKAGLECEKISGFAKNSYQDIGRIQHKSNHAWNSVKINEEWKLLDVTWGSGYVDEKCKKFSRFFNPVYLFPKPEQFIVNHFPENSEWQLLAQKVEKKDFFYFPLPHNAFFYLDYKFLNQKKGIINVPEDTFFEFNYLTAIYEPHIAINWSDVYRYKIIKISGYNQKIYNSVITPVESSYNEHNHKFQFKLTKPSKYLFTIVVNGIETLTYIIKVDKLLIPGRLDEK